MTLSMILNGERRKASLIREMGCSPTNESVPITFFPALIIETKIFPIKVMTMSITLCLQSSSKVCDSLKPF